MTMTNHIIYAVLQLFTIVSLGNGAQIPHSTKHSTKLPKEPTVRIQCLSGVMLITIKDAPSYSEFGIFSGMIYPKGLSKNSTCLSEYRNHEGPLRYKLPLRSCNTMPQETNDGDIEFFNTIVLQPHLKLVTEFGRGYHVRCRYKNRLAATNSSSSSTTTTTTTRTNWAENPQPFRSDNNEDDNNEQNEIINTINNNNNDRRDHGRSLDKTETIYATSNDVSDYNQIIQMSHNSIVNEYPLPGCHMKIYNRDEKIAENVKIGDPLTLVVSIDEQNIYGLRVTDCLVRDGLGWSEQRLVSGEGCPVDQEIMGPFEYNENRTAARVMFQAHKFPYTASVYYQCNVRLCFLDHPECNEVPDCKSNKRVKRQTFGEKDDDGMPATIEVYSGLYVNENADVSEGSEDSVFKEKTPDNALCVSQRTFAIAIAIAGLILMLAVVAAVLCIMARRRSKTVSNSGSSIYSGPYTNTAFSHSS